MGLKGLTEKFKMNVCISLIWYIFYKNIIDEAWRLQRVLSSILVFNNADRELLKIEKLNTSNSLGTWTTAIIWYRDTGENWSFGQLEVLSLEDTTNPGKLYVSFSKIA